MNMYVLWFFALFPGFVVSLEKCAQQKKFCLNDNHRKCDTEAEKKLPACVCCPTIPRTFRSQVFYPAVVGGENAEPNEYPHMVALGFGDWSDVNWNCGGSLISKKHVLTAAHCCFSRQYGVVTGVFLGSIDLGSPNFIYRKISNINRHPQYIPSSKYHDIAVLELETPIVETLSVKPALLQRTFVTPPGNITATGWGLTSFNGATSQDLITVTLKIYSNTICRQTYETVPQKQLPEGIREDMYICAGGDDNEKKDTCQGDSGGPLQVKVNDDYVIIGVTSFGKACGVPGVPGVYTRVSYYVSWIEGCIYA